MHFREISRAINSQFPANPAQLPRNSPRNPRTFSAQYPAQFAKIFREIPGWVIKDLSIKSARKGTAEHTAYVLILVYTDYWFRDDFMCSLYNICLRWCFPLLLFHSKCLLKCECSKCAYHNFCWWKMNSSDCMHIGENHASPTQKLRNTYLDPKCTILVLLSVVCHKSVFFLADNIWKAFESQLVYNVWLWKVIVMWNLMSISALA